MDSRHCEQSKANYDIDFQWIASDFRPRYDVAVDFSDSLAKTI
jgi:hypothetical protein